MVDILFVILFCYLSMFSLDQLGYWKVILNYFGADIFTHHFWATYIIINSIFYSFSLFLAYFDLNNISNKVGNRNVE